MMQFDILTLFPEIFPNVLETSILGRAAKNKLLSFRYTNIRDYSKDKHNRVDDYPYGGGCGMVMQPQPIFDAYSDITKNCAEKPLTVVMSPRGKTFNQQIAKEMVQHNHIVLICGHYEGIDQRLIDEIADYELSVGDFVLTGGELGAMIICDAVSRLVPGVLAEEESFTGESHYNDMLEYPQYTRPVEWMGREVPEVLLSGNQKEIDEWRDEQSLVKTETVRPDLFEKSSKTPYCIRILGESSCFFKLIACDFHGKRDEIYKTRRKFAKKLANQGFHFSEISTVFTDKNKLAEFLKNESKPVIIVADTSSSVSGIAFTTPVLVLSDKADSSSLYPFFSIANLKDVNENVLNFLSLLSVIKKYSENI